MSQPDYKELSEICKKQIPYMLYSGRFSPNEKKWFLILLAVICDDDKILNDIITSSPYLTYLWIHSQTRKGNKWVGDLQLYTSYHGTSIMTYYYEQTNEYKFEISTSLENDKTLLYDHLLQIYRLINGPSNNIKGFLTDGSMFAVKESRNNQKGQVFKVDAPVRGVNCTISQVSIPRAREIQFSSFQIQIEKGKRSVKLMATKQTSKNIIVNCSPIYNSNHKSTGLELSSEMMIKGFRLSWIMKNYLFGSSFQASKLQESAKVEIIKEVQVDDLTYDGNVLKNVLHNKMITAGQYNQVLKKLGYDDYIEDMEKPIIGKTWADIVEEPEFDFDALALTFAEADSDEVSLADDNELIQTEFIMEPEDVQHEEMMFDMDDFMDELAGEVDRIGSQIADEIKDVEVDMDEMYVIDEGFIDSVLQHRQTTTRQIAEQPKSADLSSLCAWMRNDTIMMMLFKEDFDHSEQDLKRTYSMLCEYILSLDNHDGLIFVTRVLIDRICLYNGTNYKIDDDILDLDIPSTRRLMKRLNEVSKLNLLFAERQDRCESIDVDMDDFML